ncbi:hypothetical protein JTE90_024785 [Oedothorax gibbosus]|uniref:Uncharacterized protein n=1 Tax=Oedothorax gibbosus TaxID=931172 RepID=A0AAV6UA80_9ARAC|nr:hypothetical protein JTE90_024785 [Oedothorax gibbosus]
MQELSPRPASAHIKHTPFVHAGSHVFVRRDSVKKPLQPPYDGPFKVLDRTDKTFTLDINTKRSVINIDRLKPAFIIAEDMDVSRSSATSSALKTPNLPSPVPGVSPRSPNMPCSPSSPQATLSSGVPQKTTRSGRHVRFNPRALRQLVDEKRDFPQALEVVLRDCYVDDLLTGAKTEKDAIQLASQLMQMMERGGLTLRKWCSNSPKLLRVIPEDLREDKSLIEFNCEKSVMVLGVNWQPGTDTFTINVNRSDALRSFNKGLPLGSPSVSGLQPHCSPTSKPPVTPAPARLRWSLRPHPDCSRRRVPPSSHSPSLLSFDFSPIRFPFTC